jgi:hypothetical protein
MKNLYKETKLDCDTHDCKFDHRCCLDKGWQAKHEDYVVSL